MSTSAAIEVALGLVFMYFVFSTLCSGINEAISRLLNRRGSDLFKTINALLGDSAAVEQFWNHPLVRGLSKSRNKASTMTAVGHVTVPAKKGGLMGWVDGVRSLRWTPSYITPATFATVIRDISGAKGDMESLRGWLSSEQASGAVPKLLQPLVEAAGDDIDRFERNLQAWYGDTMDRLSGSYKRWTKLVLLALAAVVVVAFNINTMRVAEVLWREPSRRAAVALQAQNPTADQQQTIQSAADETKNLPIGWSDATDGGSVPWVLAGWLLSVGAISLGAPFWFDMLGRLGSLRSTGPPPAKDKDP